MSRVRGLGVRESAKASVTTRNSQFSELGVRGFPLKFDIFFRGLGMEASVSTRNSEFS